MQCGQLTTYKCSKAVVGMCCALSHAITVMNMNKWNIYSTRMCFLICSDNAVYRSGPRNVCNVVVNVCYASTGVSPPLNIDLSQQQNRKSVCKFPNSDDSDRCRVVQAGSHTIAETCQFDWNVERDGGRDTGLPPTSTVLQRKMPSGLGTPVNTALFIYILYSVQRIFFPSVTKQPSLLSAESAHSASATISTRTGIPHEFKAGYSWMPKSHSPTVLFRIYTPKTLEPFNGSENGRILLAINRIVFDVTSGRSFYGPSKCDVLY